jgi:hypothetical protein
MCRNSITVLIYHRHKLLELVSLVAHHFVQYVQEILEAPRLRVFENRVLRRIFGPKRDEMTGGWRKLHNEELHNS